MVYEINVNDTQALVDICKELMLQGMQFSARKVGAAHWKIEIQPLDVQPLDVHAK